MDDSRFMYICLCICVYAITVKYPLKCPLCFKLVKTREKICVAENMLHFTKITFLWKK